MLVTLTAIGTTGWVASIGAGDALRQATHDRLTAVRETRRHGLERYFEELSNHVVALSTAESTTLALAEFEAAWAQLGALQAGSPSDDVLLQFYRENLGPRVTKILDPQELVQTWFPREARVRQLQYHVIAANPHPVGAKDLLLEIGPSVGPYSDAHARHHPTLHRYRSAFGFYDIFLISASGRVLYSVTKEIDLGADLAAVPYAHTGLGRAFDRARKQSASEDAAPVVIEDYTPYVASAFAPAAFIAAPVRVAGAMAGVLAMQLSIREVDRVMTGGRSWREGGFGETGQAYVIGSDATLRSDLRGQIEDPDRFLERLQAAGVPTATLDRIRQDGTTVLNLPVDLHVVERIGAAENGTELGVNLLGTPVLRSHAAVELPDLRWTLVAEVDADEALAPVRALQRRIAVVGLLLAALFFIAAGWLGATVTRPVLELAHTVARLGAGQRGATVPVRSTDEVGQLAAAFNRMSEDLERTTVSKAELEVLAGRLISAQEDERSRIGRELHDDVVQRIAATAIEVGRLGNLPLAAEADRQAGLTQLKRTLATLSEDVHNLSRRVHPAMLDERGLVGSVEAECRAFMERGGVPVDVSVNGRLDDLPIVVSLTVYRIVQEGLRNIWQHADATEVGITIVRRTSDVALEIIDDGRGFDRDDPHWRPGLGLASMEERARLVGGRVAVTSAPGQGTRIRVTLPVTSS